VKAIFASDTRGADEIRIRESGYVASEEVHEEQVLVLAQRQHKCRAQCGHESRRKIETLGLSTFLILAT